MVNPDLAGFLDTNRIACVSKDLLDNEVANDDVSLPDHAQTDALECCSSDSD